MTSNPNLAPRTVASFGDEWHRFDQQGMAPGEVERVFGDYFAIFPWEQLPPRPKQLVTDLIALAVYWPLARLAERLGLPVAAFLLSYYRSCSYYTMRTDARDRFGTPLEQCFTRAQIHQMCAAAGLLDLQFSSRASFWCVVGFKAES